jgi:ABC-2 type transport system permease protein
VNWQHLQAFLWLRWRLLVNQWRRGGPLNAMLMMILAVGLLVMAVPLFATCFAIGLFAFPGAAPVHLLYAWDGMIVGFVFFWGIGLLTELQRTETLSLSKFLHLPVSVNGAFLINYASSLLRLSLIVFVPVMFGFGLALVVSRGVLLLSVLPLTAAFLLMVTALTYQFQGWLASLMSNPRRRRTVVVVATGVFVLIFQLPNLLNVLAPWGQRRADQSAKLVEELAALDRAVQSGEFDPVEHLRRQQEVMQQHQLATEQAEREGAERLQRTARFVNLVLPIGWLPLGVMTAAEGNLMPALLGSLGMTLIGAGCLWRAYRTTIGLYQGQFTFRKGAPAPAVASLAGTRQPGACLLETRLPGLSEPVSAIALGGLRSLLRSPESKIMLLTPVLLGAVFGSMVLRSPNSGSDSVRTLLAIGAIGLSLFGTLHLMANQFGFDRDGFRVFVLCAAPRRDILLGKNLAFAPLVLGMAVILLTIVQVVRPMRWDHFLSMLPQSISMFLLFCILMNLISIYAPMHIAAGSLKPTTPKLVPMLLQMVMVICLFPLTEAPTLLPLAIEAVLEWQGLTARAPICLVLSLAQCAAVVFIYRRSLNWQGDLFQAREQRILDTVTNRAP